MGVRYYLKLDERYEGEWKNGQMTGFGKYYY